MRRLGLLLALGACAPGSGGPASSVDLETMGTTEASTSNPGIQTVTSLTEQTDSGATSPATDTTQSVDSDATSPTSTDAESGTTEPPAVCGNGKVEGDEACDDGNDDDGDDCTIMCRPPGCGDGILHVGEVCDDGNASDNDACTNGCEEARCGDGIVWDEMEACDDANDVETDACLSNCKNAKCGDGKVWVDHEFCDDGFNDNEYNGCARGCQMLADTRCGDDVVQEQYEHCDGKTQLVGVECTEDCLYDFSKVPQMSCSKTCSWAGPSGCGQEDADVFCKLRTGNPNGKASAWKLAAPTDANGFACSDPKVYLDPDLRKPLGILTEYGVNKNVLYQDNQIATTHGNAQVIQGASLVCTP